MQPQWDYQPPSSTQSSPYRPPSFSDAAGPSTAIESSAKTWQIVAIVGFLTGFGFITSPLTWYKGNQLLDEAAAMGIRSLAAQTTRDTGRILTYVLYGMVIVGLLLILLVPLLLIAADHGR